MTNIIKSTARIIYYTQIINLLILIRQNYASGRLALRNSERFGVAHLYFKDARLIHVTGSKGESEAVLLDILCWTYANIRFEAGIHVGDGNVTVQTIFLYERWLSHLEMQGNFHGISETLLQSFVLQMQLDPNERKALSVRSDWQEHKEAISHFLREKRSEQDFDVLRAIVRRDQI